MTSILLPSFKRPHLLRLGLSSILRFKPTVKYEIIVLNDGIKDETENVCNSFVAKGLNIRYLFTGQRNLNGVKSRVPGFALNIGFKQSKGDIVVLSCPEMYYLNNVIDIIVSYLINNVESESMVIPNFIYFDQKQEVTNNLLKLNDTELMNPTIDTSLLTGGVYGSGHVIMPFLMAIYKKPIMEIGGYDEDFIGYAGDDNDFIGRLQLKGLRHLRTHAKAIHLYHLDANDGLCHWDNPQWVLNYNLFQGRKNIIVRNKNREWGKYEE